MVYSTMAGHVVLGVIVIVFGLLHRHDLRKITIEFKNGKDKEPHDES